mmetsp:Transcript_24042/g.35475  ORF Transcript_24042/g.35475 Transcript_24042/m.35475 type:complete len:120 (-) Transcript_24042:535-894(-)
MYCNTEDNPSTLASSSSSPSRKQRLAFWLALSVSFYIRSQGTPMERVDDEKNDEDNMHLLLIDAWRRSIYYPLPLRVNFTRKYVGPFGNRDGGLGRFSPYNFGGLEIGKNLFVRSFCSF